MARDVPIDYNSADYGSTVKQRVLRRLKDKIAVMQDGGEDLWRAVYWGDLEDLDNVGLPAVGFDYGTEEHLQIIFPCQEFRVPVFIYFRFRGARGLVEQEVYEYYLGLLKLALLGDHNLPDGSGENPVALNVEEESNAHTIIGIEDTYPGGTLSVNVTYRTRLHNPYKLPHES